MEPFVIILVFISACMHAGWNLFAKRSKNELIFFSQMLLIISIGGFFPAILSEILTHSLTLKAWRCVIGSGFFCGIYFYSLARAYNSSDFTVVYPVARSLPILFIAIGDILRGRILSGNGWLGISLVVAGCIFTPLKSLKDFSLSHYLNRTSAWLILTASGTIGYTILDKISSEVVLQGPATAARYGYFFFFITCIIYHIFLKLFHRKIQIKKTKIMNWKLPSFASLFDFASYWLILWAYQLTKFASYVVAFRQVSILIGVIFAFSFYKEEGFLIRTAGAFLLTTGLLIIALLT
ncbi:EamA family transporter [bacterium]|nr:EamA family transporter [bacterium]